MQHAVSDRQNPVFSRYKNASGKRAKIKKPGGGSHPFLYVAGPQDSLKGPEATAQQDSAEFHFVKWQHKL